MIRLPLVFHPGVEGDITAIYDHYERLWSVPTRASRRCRVGRPIRRGNEAWQDSDIDSLVTTLREDVRLAMPPVPSWFAGRDDVVAMIASSVLPLGRFRLLPAYFNAQPSFTLTVTRPDGITEEIGQMVLVVDASGISRIDVFAGL